MRMIEKVQLEDSEYLEFKTACKKYGRSMRKMTTVIICEFLQVERQITNLPKGSAKNKPKNNG